MLLMLHSTYFLRGDIVQQNVLVGAGPGIFLEVWRSPLDNHRELQEATAHN